jgi:hypothetical protein
MTKAFPKSRAAVTCPAKGDSSMRFARAGFCCMAVTLLFAIPAAQPQELQHRPAEQNPRVVTCTVLEAHASSEPAVRVVLFHQRDRADASRLQSLLRRVSEGAAVEFQSGDASEWRTAAVARLKSCFGRGLLILPAGAAGPPEGGTFLLRFPVGALKDSGE